MATMDCCVFTLLEISKQKPPISSGTSSSVSTEKWLENNKDCVTELKFELNSNIQKTICDAKTQLMHKMDNLYLKLNSFNNYGKTAIKEMKTHPDAFIQIAMQVAAFRTKGG